MTPSAPRFFVTGGTLPQEAACYVRRTADDEVFRCLNEGEFCYVLTSRQMGKSSLMVRTAARLRAVEQHAAVIDLTALGVNISPEQWYRGMLRAVAGQLGLEEAAEQHWRDTAARGFSPLQCWMTGLEHCILPHCRGGITLFVDEIDLVRSLAFAADEFFAGIREWYNRRSIDPSAPLMTFCLLGVATPSELMQDARNTPFNVGRRVALSDFTPEEILTFLPGMRNGDRSEASAERLLRRVGYWTGGHPYLTQRLCQTLAETPLAQTPADVDRLCQTLFFRNGAREEDDNLLFVRDRLLRGGEDRSAILDSYQKLLRGQRISDSEEVPVASALRLSGIARRAAGSRGDSGGTLQLRNRIYRRVFDARWAREQLPGAERRRQQRAYRLGVARALAGSGAVTAFAGWLAASAIIANGRTGRAEEQVRHQLFIADMQLAQQAYNQGDINRALEILDQHRANGTETSRVEYRLLRHFCQEQEATIGPLAAGGAVVLAPAAHGLLATRDDAGDVTVWESASAPHRRPSFRRSFHAGGQGMTAAFSPDGSLIAVGDNQGFTNIWDVTTGRLRGTLPGGKRKISALAFSPQDNQIAVGDFDGVVRVWTIPKTGPAADTIAPIAPISSDAPRRRGMPAHVSAAAFTPDGKSLAVAWSSGKIGLYSRAQPLSPLSLQRILMGHTRTVPALAFGPGGHQLLSGDKTGTLHLWDADHGTLSATLKAPPQLCAAAFSPDGRWAAAAGEGKSLFVWDLSAAAPFPRELHGHLDSVTALAFLPTANADTAANRGTVHLASGGQDGRAMLWKWNASRTWMDTGPLWASDIAADGHRTAIVRASDPYGVLVWDTVRDAMIAEMPRPHRRWVWSVALSNTGGLLATGAGDGMARLWSLPESGTLSPIPDSRPLTGTAGEVHAVALSPDTRQVAVGDDHGSVTLYDSATKTVVRSWRTNPTPARHRDISHLAFSPDGALLAAASLDDGTLTLFSVQTGGRTEFRGSESSGISAFAFSPNNRLLAVAYRDGQAACYGIPPERDRAAAESSGALSVPSLSRWIAHGGDAVTALAFSPDNRTLAAAGPTGNPLVTFWDVATTRETLSLAALPGLSSPPNAVGVSALRFSADGQYLVVLDSRGRSTRWSLAPDDPKTVE